MHISWGVLENFNSRHDCVKDVYIRNLALNLVLTHWGRMTHICVSKLTMIGSDNGLSPGRRQAIIWTNTGILLIGPLGTNVSEILIEIQTFSLKKIRLKMSSAKGRLFSLGLNELNIWSFPVLMVSKWFFSDLKLFYICHVRGLMKTTKWPFKVISCGIQNGGIVVVLYEPGYISPALYVRLIVGLFHMCNLMVSSMVVG